MTDNQTFIFIRWRRFPSFFRTCAIRWLTHFSNHPFVLTPAPQAIHKQLVIKCLYIGSGAGGTERGASKTGNHRRQNRKARQAKQESTAGKNRKPRQATQESTVGNTGNGAGNTGNGAGAIFSCLPAPPSTSK